MKAKKELSHAAQVAALIRAELKKHGIKGRVTSDNYSMGNSVNVTVNDQLPATVEKIKSFCAKYQYGRFNGMEDIYEYSNSRDDIPQTKYLFVKNDYSDEILQKCWDYVRESFGYDLAPLTYAEACNYYLVKHQCWASAAVHRELSEDGLFWRQFKPRVKAGA